MIHWAEYLPFSHFPKETPLTSVQHFSLVLWGWLHLIKILDSLNRLLLHRNIKCWLIPKQVLPSGGTFSGGGYGRNVFPFTKKVCSAFQYAWPSKGCRKHPFPQSQLLPHPLCIFMKTSLGVIRGKSGI